MFAAAAVNWNVVIPTMVTGATASFIALLSWLGTRSTVGSAERQNEAQAQRVQEQRAEEHLQHRQGIYHDLMNAERRALRLLAREHPSPDSRAAVSELYDHLNGAILFGTKEVAVGSVRFMWSIAALQNAVETRSQERQTEASRDWIDSRRVLINAMRRDVSPDASEIDEWPELQGPE